MEIVRSIHDNSDELCEKCGVAMERLISRNITVLFGTKGTVDDHKEKEHQKKTKDPERAVRMRKKAFGSDAVGDPGMQSDPKHIIKRGRVIAGQQTEIDKKEFIKAAAKDNVMVETAKNILKRKKK